MREGGGGGGGGSFSPTLESERASFAAFLSTGQLVVGQAAGRPVDLSEAEWAHPVCVSLSRNPTQQRCARPQHTTSPRRCVTGGGWRRLPHCLFARVPLKRRVE